MSIRDELKNELLEEFDRHLDEACHCSMKPGSLEKIMTQAAQKMARLTQESLARAASQEADFSPSGVPVLRRAASLQPEEKAEAGGDSVR